MPEDRKQAMRQLYESFNRGDIEPVIKAMTEDVTWDAPGASPFAGRRMGRDQVRQFFAEAMQAIQIDQFDVDDVLADGDKVVVLGRQRATGPANWPRFFAALGARLYLPRRENRRGSNVRRHPCRRVGIWRFDQGAGRSDRPDGRHPPGVFGAAEQRLLNCRASYSTICGWVKRK